MDAKHNCSRCGAPMTPDALKGLCPRCLMGLNLGTQTEMTGSDSGAAPEKRKAPPTPEEIAPFFPQFQILECLGRGGMGVVYKAVQKSLDRMVALKILAPEREKDPQFAGRFAKEAKLLAQLNHPNIVTVHDFGETSGMFYLVMEFVDGMNLRQLLRDHKLAPEEALAIVPPVCEALQYAHSRGVVHRDIKPENLLLDKQGRIKIADFGIARLMGGEASAAGLAHSVAQGVGPVPAATDASKVVGTPAYMAPEQANQPSKVDHRADIYSLGVVLFEMLTGELPAEQIQPPSSRRIQVDVRIDEIVLKALEHEPEKRYQTADQFKTRVESFSAPGNSGRQQPPASVFGQAGVDFKSQQMLFSLPWVHVATGVDPVTGRKRIARGIIAIGDVAIGFLAFGGVALGGVAMGGVAAGGLSIGGLSIGLIALGGLAIALIAAFGGGAIAPIAVGGGAMGYLACGGKGMGTHVLDAMTRDPVAERFFLPWTTNLFALAPLINIILVLLCAMALIGSLLWVSWLSNGKKPDNGSAPLQGPQSRYRNIRKACAVGCGVWMVITLVAAFIAIKQPRQYTSKVMISIESDESIAGTASTPDPFFVQTIIERIRSAPVLAKVVDRLKLNERWRGETGLSGPSGIRRTLELLAKRIAVRQFGSPEMFEIRAVSASPIEAAELANAIVDCYKIYRSEQVTSLAGSDKAQRQAIPALRSLQVYDPAVPMMRSSWPNTRLVIAQGALGGAAAGLIAGFLVFRFSHKRRV